MEDLPPQRGDESRPSVAGIARRASENAAGGIAACKHRLWVIKQKHILELVERLLLSRFAPTSLVVDERGTIIYIHGRTGAYLEPSEGQPRHNILEMARHGLARPLAAAMRQAAAEKREVVRENVRVKTDGELTHVNLSVMRIEEPASDPRVAVGDRLFPRPRRSRRQHREVAKNWRSSLAA